MANKDKYPTISLVTPSFNQGKFLESTLRSVLEQEYPNLEYIVIDGGSTDKSLQIIQKYKKKLTYFESKKDHGQSHAINKGFAKTSGEIMAWINSDDVLRPGSLNLIASIFAQFPEIEWLTSLPSTINEAGHLIYLSQPPLYIRSFIRKGWYTRKFMGFIMQEGTFWRRSLWDKSGGKLDEVPYSMDMKLWQKFAEHAQLYCVEACLASYRLNPNRKNNDEHHHYYQEMKDNIPVPLALLGKMIWRQVQKLSHHLRVTPSIFFDQKNLEWKFRKKLFDVKLFKLLGNT